MKKLLILILMVGITVGIGLGVWRIRVGQISCESQYGPCSEVVESALVSYEGGRWLGTKKKMVEKLSSLSMVEEYKIEYKLPNRLEIEIVEGKAEVAVKEENEEKYNLVSRKGAVLGVSDETQLPKIIFKSGEVSFEEKVFAIGLMDELFAWKGIRSGEVVDGGLEVNFEGGVRAIFPLNGDVDVLLGAINLILSWLNSQAQDTRISLVDLRYQNPVIK